MQNSLGASQVLEILIHDAELGSVALSYIKPDVRKRLNILAHGIHLAKAEPTESTQRTQTQIFDAYTNYRID